MNLDDVMERVEGRLARLPQPVAHEVKLALTSAEANFWLNPWPTYHGGLPCFLVYLTGDGAEFPVVIKAPEEVGGRDVLGFMWDLLLEHDAKTVIYSCTSRSGCLFAIAMSGSALYSMRCPILPYRDTLDLGDWTVESHKV